MLLNLLSTPTVNAVPAFNNLTTERRASQFLHAAVEWQLEISTNLNRKIKENLNDETMLGLQFCLFHQYILKTVVS